MSTDDQSSLSDINTLRALILGEDDAALRSVGELTARVGSVEALLRQDPVTVEKLQALLSDVLHGLDGPERRRVQDRLMALMLSNIQHEINAAKPGFVQAIYPVAGGLVRKGIQQAIAELLEQIEERLAEPVNIYKRTQIRFEALITGKPEAEIWLRQRGLCHVDRILLVDRATGTVMTGLRQGRDGVVTDTIDTEESVQGEDQIVSGMLTAIMSVSREAFGAGSTGESSTGDGSRGDGGRGSAASADGVSGGELTTLEFENSQLHIKATPLVLLVVRTIGTPPAKIDSIIDNRFDRMVTDNAEALSGFDGAMDRGSRLEVQAQIRRLLRELRRAEPEDRQTLRRGSRRRPVITFVIALVGIILTALLILVAIDSLRIGSAVSRVQRSLTTLDTLQAYPLDASYSRQQASVLVRGLVPNAASAGELQTLLRQKHPNLSIDFRLSNLVTDAVDPSLRAPRIEREANSVGLGQLREDALERDRVIRDLEQQVAALQASLAGQQAVDAARQYPALTYDLDPQLGALRDQTEADQITATTDEEAIVGTLIGFTASGSFADVEQALEAAKRIVALMAEKPSGARLEILPVTRSVMGRQSPPSLESFIASKVRALAVAQGLDPAVVRIRSGARAASVTEIDAGSWRKSHYVGFRLAY